MIKFKSQNIDGETREWSFDSVEYLKVQPVCKDISDDDYDDGEEEFY